MAKKLRIAQIGTVWESTPPKLYGGTERIVSLLTEGLVKCGHDVTLFATGDSKTKAKLISVVPHSVYRMKLSWHNLTYPLMNMYEAYKTAGDFDILHVHLNIFSDYAALMLTDLLDVPTVFTMHFNLPTEDKDKDRYLFLNKFSKSNYVSVSNSQRSIDSLKYVATVYNGIDVGKYQFNSDGGDGLFWLGRFSVKKGAYEAIQTAIDCQKKLIMAGRLDTKDKVDQEYYDKEVKPRLKVGGKLIDYIGEIDDANKSKYLGKSKCLVNPINWREPFGLVVAEANACGTPVVAFSNGSMPEIIRDGINGYLVKAGDVAGMVKMVNKIYQMSDNEYRNFRKTSRKYAEKNFSSDNMVTNYEELYQKVIEQY